MGKRKIEWCDHTINPVIGCSMVSDGCKNCYAEKMACRLANMAINAGTKTKQYCEVTNCNVIDNEVFDLAKTWNGKTVFVPSALKRIPQKGKKVFIGSMGDLFHETVPFYWIDTILAFCAVNPQHTFLILTKRPERMKEYFTEYPSYGKDGNIVYSMTNEFPFETYNVYPETGNPEPYCDIIGCSNLKASPDFCCPDFPNVKFPLQNLWLGVTCENQETANKRIPILLDIPATRRFVSVEPMLGEVDLQEACTKNCSNGARCHTDKFSNERVIEDSEEGGLLVECICSRLNGLDWVICGAETGPRKRVMKQEWVEDLFEQCKEAGVPFFWKKNSNGNTLKVGGEVVREFPA